MTEPNPPDQPDIENIYLLYALNRQKARARITTDLRTRILPTLRHHQVASIEATYSGYGDSGAIDGVQFHDAAGERIDQTSLPNEITEALENCLYEFLPSGFEINDGGQGTLTIDVETAKVTLHHQENYTAINETTQEFTL